MGFQGLNYCWAWHYPEFHCGKLECTSLLHSTLWGNTIFVLWECEKGVFWRSFGDLPPKSWKLGASDGIWELWRTQSPSEDEEEMLQGSRTREEHPDLWGSRYFPIWMPWQFLSMGVPFFGWMLTVNGYAIGGDSNHLRDCIPFHEMVGIRASGPSPTWRHGSRRWISAGDGRSIG